MKRLPEFILSLIGAILAIFTSIASNELLGKLPVNVGGDFIKTAYKFSEYGILIAFFVIILSFMLNNPNYTKIASEILMILSLILFLTNFTQIISFVLILISGIMGIARKV